MDGYEIKVLDLMSFDTSRFHINSGQFDLCADYIAALFSEIGFNIEIIPTELGKLVIGKRFLNTSHSHVHLNGHYDVVPPTADSRTVYDKHAKSFFGRGCSDMKGGIISIWLACKKALESKINCNISFSFSPDEETGGKVASAKLIEKLSDFLPNEALVIIADSSYPNILLSHRGAYWVNVKIALDSTKRFATKACSAFEIMCHYYDEFSKAPKDAEVVIGGHCTTSEATNMWVHTAVFSLDYRFDTPKSLEEIKKWADAHLCRVGDHIMTELALEASPISWESSLEVKPCVCLVNFDCYLKAVSEAIPNATIEKGKGFYDLRRFRGAGFWNSLVLGPGDVLNAHVKDEVLKAKNITECSTAYVRLMEGVANGAFKSVGVAKV